MQKEIEIAAPKDRVWTVLLEDTYSKDWYSLFSEGTTAQSDWIEGNKISFTDKSGNGIFGKIARKKPYEKLSFVYEGFLNHGIEDTESPMAKEFKGAEETYRLSDHDGNTLLSISCDMSDEMFNEMSRKWEAALQRIAELAHAV
ncbi:MAG: SRPBCC domain-containing protein [Flavobacterium sp.]|nr:MAG: SRPBCC domain-containing protein [Flavobacterium sp.]